jgi:hypothetical protein
MATAACREARSAAHGSAFLHCQRNSGLGTAINADAAVESGGSTVPYGCEFEDLLTILHERAPAKADAVAVHRRRTEHGLLSVGLKIHDLGHGGHFFSLVERLGGALRVLEINISRVTSSLLFF